ncbi:tRNA (adenosine(37)-N6)-threonylcarbamoyltransferase complex transferase subunit TsaD [Terasakiella sp. A23]|uniref:tRNA (adenosine(37)-N6)-threonylcarbamoyltransferase complex transferase subunit TsaD n=1 Tax=Terasakiella sp. FCG-A23 TaxID=3080561 RepID=UPI0029549C43|nr:tRNA (adenosine(37)-N6)-threonylcarbamoyltransferase complex transferase subunit TsaD [Terasakiella sp. A23]MDV7340858.1 tRNA (adenosine(37)-N6)-threonylcarbamoyltransferase complex transferase subunit TsaD [Terasakiella sp. A23]
MKILGIETSCDETAASVITDEGQGEARILSNVVLSQLDEHRPFGGVVPEIAARSHLDHIDRIVDEAMTEAGVDFKDLDAVAATGGPGLIGGVIVGVMTAKAIALTHKLPFVAVNHLEGHALTVRMTDQVEFPYLLLLVSGGHCQLLAVEAVGKYKRLGTTIDDALGEAFDKSAKLLGLGYPGGPHVEKAALKATDPTRFKLPSPMKGKPGCDFSFSGLKTAVRQAAEALPPGPFKEEDLNDLCAAFQTAAGDSLVNRCKNAIKMFKADYPTGNTLVVAGGVAANQAIRGHLEKLCAKENMQMVAPPLKLCTDNGAMIAWAGLEAFKAGKTNDLSFAPRPRWPLDPNAPKAAFAGGKKA